MVVKIFLCNFFFTIISIFILRKIIIRLKPKGIYIEKENQKVAKIGGILLLLPLLLFYRKFDIYLFTFLLVFLLGFVDDLKELKVWQKFLGQLIIVLSFIFFSGLTTEIIFFPKFVNFLITLIWILGITNALNLLDIKDGLATGVSLMISFAFLYLSILTKNFVVENFSIFLSSSLLAIFLFNLPPAKIYLGDAGSLFLGCVFSIIAILISYAKAFHEMALVSPIFILGFPIFDTIFVSLRRLSQGKSIFKKSDDHFIIYLLKNNQEKKALFTCYALCFAFIILGVSLVKLSNFFSLTLILIFLLFLIYLSFKVSRD